MTPPAPNVQPPMARVVPSPTPCPPYWWATASRMLKGYAQVPLDSGRASREPLLEAPVTELLQLLHYPVFGILHALSNVQIRSDNLQREYDRFLSTFQTH